MFTEARFLRSQLAISITGLILLAAIFMVIIFRGDRSKPKKSVEEQQKQAALLVESKLYRQALNFYQELLRQSQDEPERAAGLHYLMGEILYTHLGIPDEALAHFLLARTLDPQSARQQQIILWIVACYERLGRTAEAQRELSLVTALDKKQALREDSLAVATIGTRRITKAELLREKEILPAAVKTSFPDTPEGWTNFLKQYIGLELLYQSGLRRGYDRDLITQAYVERVRKEYVTERVVNEDITDKIQISPQEATDFFQANLKLFGGKSFEMVKDTVLALAKNIKQRQMYQDAVQRLWTAEKVQIFVENLK